MPKLIFDVMIIGGGIAGATAALEAAKNGLKVALVEKEFLGGITVNNGYIPLRHLLEKSHILASYKLGHLKNLFKKESVEIHLDELFEEAKKECVQVREEWHNSLTKHHVTLLFGHAEILDRNVIRVNGLDYFTTNLILATGADYTLLGDSSLKEFTPKTILNLKFVPDHLAIVGAGVIGIEMAILFSNFGAKVTIYEKEQQLMPYLDTDQKRELLTLLNAKKIRLVTNKHILVGTELPTSHDVVLWTTSRKISKEFLQVLTDQGLLFQHDFVQTDNCCRTSIPGVYAIGDINGKAMLSSIAQREGIVAVHTIIGKKEMMHYDLTPFTLYTSPQFSSVGWTEEAAKTQGYQPAIAKIALHTNGFIKIVCDNKTEEILGVQITSKEANAMITQAASIMQKDGTVDDFINLVVPTPSFIPSMLEISYMGFEKKKN